MLQLRPAYEEMKKKIPELRKPWLDGVKGKQAQMTDFHIAKVGASAFLLIFTARIPVCNFHFCHICCC